MAERGRDLESGRGFDSGSAPGTPRWVMALFGSLQLSKSHVPEQAASQAGRHEVLGLARHAWRARPAFTVARS